MVDENALRAPTDNDNWFYTQWFENGLHNLKHKVLSSSAYMRADGATVLSYTVESQAPNGASIQGGASGRYRLVEHTDRPFGPEDFKFITNQVWTIYRNGYIEFESGIMSDKPSLVLPRLGYVMKIPARLSNYTYYGRGPVNNYNDRKTGSFIERYHSTVQEQYVPWPKPQSTGNREEVRWCALTDNDNTGVLFMGTSPLSVSALPYSALDMTLAPHTYQLPQAGDTYLHLDLGVTGLGGNSCGQGGPLGDDRISATPHTMGFIIRPVVNDKNFISVVNVSGSGDMPIIITRGKNGMVEIKSAKADDVLCFSVDGAKKPTTYTKPFALAEGGKVEAWSQSAPQLKASMQFSKIESISTEVVYASSVETGEGDASHLTDGDPGTYWHTMYSVTVAQYPHWVDLDAGTEKMIKGFVYLPR